MKLVTDFSTSSVRPHQSGNGSVGDPPPEWSPAALFAGGDGGLWLDPGDMAQFFQDAAGTQPVTDIDQPVALVRNSASADRYAAQTQATARPMLRSTPEGQRYLEFDGLGAHLVTTPLGLGNSEALTVVVGFRKTQDATIARLLDTTESSPSFSLSAPAATNLSRNNAVLANGSNSVVLDGDAPGDRDMVYTLGCVLNDALTLFRDGVQIGQGAFPGSESSTWGNNQAFHIAQRTSGIQHFTGRLYGLIAVGRVLTPVERGQAEAWMAARMGLPL